MSCLKLRNTFGSILHGPRAVCRKHAKAQNKGRDLNLIKPSETRMAGELLQFLRLFLHKDALKATTRDRVFVDFKRFDFVTSIVNSDAFWHVLFAIIQGCYPVFRILRLTDMKIGGMDKLYFYVCQMDRLLEQVMQNVMDQWNDPATPKISLEKMNLQAEDKKFLKGKSRCLFEIPQEYHF
jgi:hypothetical protein